MELLVLPDHLLVACEGLFPHCLTASDTLMVSLGDLSDTHTAAAFQRRYINILYTSLCSSFRTPRGGPSRHTHTA